MGLIYLQQSIMKYLKLGIISVVAFYLLFWMFTMLFPNNVVISRACNVGGNRDTVKHLISSNRISYRQWLIGSDTGLDLRTADIPFYTAELANVDNPADADTIFWQVRKQGITPVRGGLAFYNLQADSTTVQLYYVFENKWYKPWEKLASVFYDKRLSPSIDSALQRLKAAAEAKP
jgi:hypothetical protein